MEVCCHSSEEHAPNHRVTPKARVVCRWRTEIPIDTAIIESCDPQRAARSECPKYTTVSSCSRVCVTFTCSNSSCAIRSRTGCGKSHGFCCTNATLVTVTIVCVLTRWKSWVLLWTRLCRSWTLWRPPKLQRHLSHCTDQLV